LFYWSCYWESESERDDWLFLECITVSFTLCLVPWHVHIRMWMFKKCTFSLLCNSIMDPADINRSLGQCDWIIHVKNCVNPVRGKRFVSIGQNTFSKRPNPKIWLNLIVWSKWVTNVVAFSLSAFCITKMVPSVVSPLINYFLIRRKFLEILTCRHAENFQRNS
jgi:hypothetical protein